MKGQPWEHGRISPLQWGPLVQIDHEDYDAEAFGIPLRTCALSGQSVDSDIKAGP